MSEQRINVELLEKVVAVILEEPRKLDMGTWASDAEERIVNPDHRPPCGTVACIAGWACFIAKQERGEPLPKGAELYAFYDKARDEAMELLGLDEDEADLLFDCPTGDEEDDLWPGEYVRAYVNADTPAERAQATAARINRFISTDGAE
jgi:hypothetical protein